MKRLFKCLFMIAIIFCSMNILNALEIKSNNIYANINEFTEQKSYFINILEFSGNGFGEIGQSCVELVGENISKIIKSSFTILRIVGAIIAIVNAMITLIPAVVSKNADALKKAANKCVTMGIVLAIIGIFPSIVILIARLFDYDISCLM